MKNSLKLLALAAVCAAAISCETKPSTVSYTLGGTFSYIAEAPQSYTFVDSLYYNKYVMLDNYSALCSSCEEMNSNFNGGWKISLKKGSSSEGEDLQMFASAGPNAGFTEPKSGVANKAYAVYTPSLQDFDISFRYKDYFSKSTCYVSGFYINNTKYVETLADNGQITDGDYLKVTASFFKGALPVGTEDFYLVDYTGAEKKVVKDWTVWEMKDAAKLDVDGIKFTVSSAKGFLPESFCMDLLVASVALEY